MGGVLLRRPPPQMPKLPAFAGMPQVIVVTLTGSAPSRGEHAEPNAPLDSHS